MTGRPPARAPAARDEPIAGEDPAAAFVRRHQRGVWRFLRALGCPAHAAEEVAQDAFLLALDRAVTDAVAPGFLRQAARFLWLRRRRDDGRATRRLAAAADRLWQRDCARDDGEGLLAALRRCVEALPERSRRVVEMVYRDDAGRADVARELQLTEHGARTLLQRLRGALRQCVERRLES